MKTGSAMNIVIVGHVDHGKSTLIGRLLYDTHSLLPEKMEEVRKVSKELGRDFEFAFVVDHLQEEREGALTIDTTQTFFKTHKRRYVIIDAPGHVEFMKNMITGATQAEAGVLIVSADRGMEEQTKRHAYILSLLGLDRIIVVINKMDLVRYERDEFERLKEEATDFLSRLEIRPAHVIPISAKLGDGVLGVTKNLRWNKGPSLVDALDSLYIETKKMNRPLRFPIQDVYKFNGEEILVGRVESGSIKKGQRVLVLPQNRETTVGSIRLFEKIKFNAEEGENIGLTLTGPLSLKRGQVLCQKGDLPKLTDKFNGNVFWMSDRPLQSKQSVTFRCATQEVECSVDHIERKLDSSTLEIITEDSDSLNLNEVGTIVFNAREPIIVERYDFIEGLGRFVLELGNEVQGSGIIT